MSDQAIVFSIDPGEQIGYAIAIDQKVLDAGVITGITEQDRFGTLQARIQEYEPNYILIENSYKYKKKISHMIKVLPTERLPEIHLLDANQLQYRLFGGPFGKYGKAKTMHRIQRNELVKEYFGEIFEVHANDALLMIIDWQRLSQI